MRRAGNGRAGDGGAGLRHHGLAVGADDHRRLHLLRVGAGVGRFQVDDVAQEDFAFVQFVAPDDDGLKRQRAFAKPGDHRLAAGLDAFGDGDFALAREQFDRAHLAQIHAHRIVGALGRLFLFGGGERLRLGLDHLAAGVVVIIVVVLVGGLLLALLRVGIVAFHDRDAHLRDHGEDVFDLVGGDLLRGQHGVDLLMGDVAALLGGLDHLLDAGVGEVEQRQRRLGRAFGFLFRSFFFCLRCLRLRRHRFLLDLPGRRLAARADNLLEEAHWPQRATPAKRRPLESGRQCARDPLKPGLTMKIPWESTFYSRRSRPSRATRPDPFRNARAMLISYERRDRKRRRSPRSRPRFRPSATGGL